MKTISMFIIFSIIISVNCLKDFFRTGGRRGRTLFHEDQDVIITMVIIFPYYFPLWERFYNTSVEQGTDAAIAEFPNLPPGGLPSCGAFCRKRRSQMERKGRFFQYDEQVVHFLLEMIAAFPVPIIPNPYAAANRKPIRPKDGFDSLPGLSGIQEIAGLFGLGDSGGVSDRPRPSGPIRRPGSFPQGIDDIGVQAPIGLFDSPTIRPNRRRPIRFGSLGPIIQAIDNIPVQQPVVRRGRTSDETLDQNSHTNQTERRNLCISSEINMYSSRSLKENCFMNTKNSHFLSAYETVSIDRKRLVSQMRLNLSSLLAAISCHFTEWYLQKRVNYFVRSFFFGTIRTICSNTNLVHFFTVVHKLCKCLILKKLI